jgi:hypothetical protein
MTDFPSEPHGLWPQHSFTGWSTGFAAVLAALLVAGVLPRLWG